MSVINYDRPVKNLISELNATGHVTHKAYKKTSVTLHHNAGRLSHEGVLNVWKTRPASAQLDVDGHGDVAQYVKANEYAWAAGDKTGNMRSIHIEMHNISLSPHWEVAETTWRSAARLAGWLFAKVIGERPDANNFFRHKHWKATSCAGPYIDSVWSRIMNHAQKWYDYFKRKHNQHKSVTQIATEVIAGKWGHGPDRVKRLHAAGYNPKAIQDEVNRRLR